MRNLFFIVFIVCCTGVGVAQENVKAYYEPYIKLGYKVTENYAHEFKIEKRSIFYADKTFNMDIKQLDLSHFSKLALNDKNAVAVGLQYRFKENFATDKENELRFTEQYTFTTQPNAVEFEHRLRAEQRITSSSTSHRFRYNFAVTRALKGTEIDTGETYIIGDMETLLTIAKTAKPKYQQRFGLGVGWVLTEVLKLELVTEYRLDDFTQDLGHELFFVTGMKLTL